MSERAFGLVALLIGLAFAVFFAAYVLPPALQSGDVIGAFAAGYVNPYAAGYSTDTILCGVILIAWIGFEMSTGRSPRHAWVCIPLAIVPGVATSFGLYLFLRTRHPSSREASHAN